MVLSPSPRAYALLLLLLAWMLNGCIELRWPDEQEIQPLPVEFKTLLPDDANLPVGWHVEPGWWVGYMTESWLIENAEEVLLFGEKPRNHVTMLVVQLRNEKSVERQWDAWAKKRIENYDNKYDGPTAIIGMSDLPALHADNAAVLCESYYDNSWTSCAVRLSFGSILADLSAGIGGRDLSVTDFIEVVRSIDTHLHAQLHRE